MSDPYTQHPYSAPPGADANSYAPDSFQPNLPYDYETQQPYTQQYPPNQDYRYGSHFDLAQAPRSYPPQTPASQQDYLSPTSAEESHQVRRRRGSNADYYNVAPGEQDQYYPGSYTSYPTDGPREAEDGKDDGKERSLGGALAGGAAGYYLGHKQEHGFLGAVGGALLGNFIGDKMEGQDHGSDDDKSSHYSHGHRHKHRHHHHHHHHHGHSHHGHHHSRHRHHRSHSRHSSHDDDF
ncbi:hypothetical protein BDV25DRAFT_164997 [Aspergillus avenaceus]|uniref:Glycine zipper 2TM domain-containing protein n=1 Tax=Aspergillus avenaceus TaxID=36643 RepID=A0A5N6TGP3_ASPAV|nr:hypothetical protein BDV25DRAFT_164997 [Aspergillus avenaceus]